MKIKQTISILIFSLMLMDTISAQESSFDWGKVRYGGRINLGFSNTTTNIILAPSAVYPLSDKFSLGGSISFGYTSFKSSDSKLYNYGASLLSYYNPFRELQLSVELEQTFVNQTTGNFKNNFDFLALYIGAGYRFGNVIAGIRYDVLYNENKGLYASPFGPFVQFSF